MPRFIVRLLLLLLLAALSVGIRAQSEPRPVRFGITPAFLHEEHTLLADWRTYLERRLKRPVEFVLRDRYRETMDLLLQQKLEFAWLCDYPYVMMASDLELTAVALDKDQPTYRAYLIVPAKDSHTRSILDLRNTVFAYADPFSNTGYLAPRFEIKQQGQDPESFFKRTFFTWSHRKVIEAVASGLAQGASVDSYIWDSLAKMHPEITAKTRIVWTSKDYGFPPIVANRNVSAAEFEAMQRVLLNMTNDEQGRALLARFHINGFIKGSPQLYDGVAAMMKLFEQK